MARPVVQTRGWDEPEAPRTHREFPDTILRCSCTQAGLLGAFLGPPCTIDCDFAQTDRPKVSVKGETGKQETLLLFTAHDTVRGQASPKLLPEHRRGPARLAVRAPWTTRSPCHASPQIHITPAAGKKLEHQGIKVELIGTIDLFFDRGNTYDFVSMGETWRS